MFKVKFNYSSDSSTSVKFHVQVQLSKQKFFKNLSRMSQEMSDKSPTWHPSPYRQNLRSVNCIKMNSTIATLLFQFIFFLFFFFNMWQEVGENSSPTLPITFRHLVDVFDNGISYVPSSAFTMIETDFVHVVAQFAIEVVPTERFKLNRKNIRFPDNKRSEVIRRSSYTFQPTLQAAFGENFLAAVRWKINWKECKIKITFGATKNVSKSVKLDYWFKTQDRLFEH